MFCKVILKLQLSASVVTTDFSLCSKSPSVVISTGARHARRAVSSEAHSCAADDMTVLLTIPWVSKSDSPSLKASLDDL